MKIQDKPKYVIEARELFKTIDIEKLITNPNDLFYISKINRLIAIFTNFSSNDGQELKRLFQVYQKWARSSTRRGHIQNRVIDMLQFIGQKIEEMDIYNIDEPIKNSQERIIKNLKNEKFWVRSSLEGKDLHIFVGERSDKQGEHVHLISDSDTGEIRVDTEDKSPSKLIERVVSITTKSGSTLEVAQYGVKTTMEFFDKKTTTNNEIPIIYATGIRRSGGPNGHFEYFTIKNISKEIALDVYWRIRAFAYEWKSTDKPFELEPNKEKEVVFQISKERIFSESIPELNIIMEYKDAYGKTYFTRRELKQTRVSTGVFFELKAGIFFPPSILVDDGLELISEPIHNGDRVEATFRINTKEGERKVKIGISRSLTATFGFDDDYKIKQAILELAHRKIRKMVKENKLIDYLFTTHELSEHHQGGFEAYIKLRDSIIL